MTSCASEPDCLLLFMRGAGSWPRQGLFRATINARPDAQSEIADLKLRLGLILLGPWLKINWL